MTRANQHSRDDAAAMTAPRGETPGSKSRVGVSCAAGIVRLHDSELFAKKPGAECIHFLRRVFTLVEVTRIEIDRAVSAASISFDADVSELSEFLARLATVLRSDLPPHADNLSSFFRNELDNPASRLRIQRFGTALTTWEIVCNRPGRIRLRHQELRGNAALASRIVSALEKINGVIECSARQVTGSLLIRFDPGLVANTDLLRVVNDARHARAFLDQPALEAPASGFALANSSLALAVTAEMAAPFLLPASAVLLVGSNLKTLHAAVRQLRQGQLGLPVLYTSIVAATLVSGQFIASAAMSWMFTFWTRQYRNDLANARRRLLGQIIDQPHYVRLAAPKADTVDVEVSIDDLAPKDVIVVAAGDLIPADGRVLEGRGLVDERVIQGVHGLTRKQADDLVCAGSTVRLGEMQIEVLQHGSQTQLAKLAQILLAATTLPHGARTPTLRGESFADRTVAPTMAIAGLGLLVGDISTAAAILRPDYATGPGVAFPLETLQAVALCLRHGILVRDPEAIEKVATADVLILEHHADLERMELEVDTVRVFPGHREEEVLRYAAAAFHELDDERAGALNRACHERGLSLLDLRPVEFTTDLTLVNGNSRIKVGDLGTSTGNSTRTGTAGQNGRRGGDPDSPDSLMIGINRQVAGLIHFHRSTRYEAVSTLNRLRSKRHLSIGIVSAEPHADLPKLGSDFQITGLSPDERLHFLQDCRRRGFKVAYVGDCERDHRVVAEAHVAISLGGAHKQGRFDGEAAPIGLITSRVSKLGELWDIASIQRRRLRVAHGYALVPNLVCIAGAFVWGFTSLASVVVTNLGTYFVYSKTAASIRSLERLLGHSLNKSRPIVPGNNDPGRTAEAERRLV